MLISFVACWSPLTVDAPHSILGTPTAKEWPGVMELPDYNPNFPQHRGRDLAEVVPGLDPLGVDLLKVCSVVRNFCVNTPFLCVCVCVECETAAKILHCMYISVYLRHVCVSSSRGTHTHTHTGVQEMLQLDPAKRISARAALQHPYFNDLVASGYNP